MIKGKYKYSVDIRRYQSFNITGMTNSLTVIQIILKYFVLSIIAYINTTQIYYYVLILF